MCAHPPGYRPEINQTLFISFTQDKPYLATVTGYHRDPRYSSEQFEFTVSASGKTKSASLENYRLFPEAAVDSRFVFLVVQESMGQSANEAWFFSPDEAFSYIEELKAGTAKSFLDIDPKDRSFRVEVEKV